MKRPNPVIPSRGGSTAEHLFANMEDSQARFRRRGGRDPGDSKGSGGINA